MLTGKKIIIAVTGSIAAYKSALLVRLLIQAEAEVKVVMTPAARDFITPLTLATLAKNPVHSDFTEDLEAGTWTNHVELGLWADAMVIAPCSASTLSKLANGQSDNFLMAVYLSAKCPVFVAPAMDLDMYRHPTTLENLAAIRKNGNLIIDSGSGELASGLYGKGRMAEPEDILGFLDNYFTKDLPLEGKKVLISAGPTLERIDPVRYISNFSSGKMGLALALECQEKGANVMLVAGPGVEASNPLINRIDVESAQEMYDACSREFKDSDMAIMAAAVADYKPVTTSDKKIKKSGEDLNIELTPNPDILKSLGTLKRADQLLIGFALETESGIEHATEKLKNKNLDFIVLNSLSDAGAGFGHDTNKITIILPDNKIRSFELKSKADVAVDIVKQIIELV